MSEPWFTHLYSWLIYSPSSLFMNTQLIRLLPPESDEAGKSTRQKCFCAIHSYVLRKCQDGTYKRDMLQGLQSEGKENKCNSWLPGRCKPVRKKSVFNGGQCPLLLRTRTIVFPLALPRLQEEQTAFEPTLEAGGQVDNMGRAWSGVGQRIKQEDKIDGLLVAVEDSSFGYFKSNRLMVFHGF